MKQTIPQTAAIICYAVDVMRLPRSVDKFHKYVKYPESESCKDYFTPQQCKKIEGKVYLEQEYC